MRRLAIFVACSLLGATGGYVLWAKNPPVQENRGVIWEYKVLTNWDLLELTPEGEDKTWVDAVHHLGAERWELVSVVETPYIRYHYFKRPK